MNATVKAGRARSRAAVAHLIVTVAMAIAAVAAAAITFPTAASADWVRNDQWQLRALDARTAWKLSTGTGVTVAVLDSGVDASHADLAGQVLPGADFVDGSTDGRVDPVGHGTTVAGLIAGRGDDSAGVVGIAPNARILPVRVLDAKNRYDDAGSVAKAIRWAVDHGATVINLSLGGPARSTEVASALAYAARRDVVVVACTGNSVGTSAGHNVWYPAREPGVIAVAGTESTTRSTRGGGGSGALWAGSLTGPETVLTAPAVNLLGARPGGYWRVQGTSFAAPLVAAAATLIRARYPQMSAANVVNRLISTARDLGPAGRDNRFGYGEIDPVAALRAEVAEVATNPLATGKALAGSGGMGPDSAPDASTEATPSGSTSGAPVPGAAPPVAAPVAAYADDPERERLRFSVVVGASVFLLLLSTGAAGLRRRRARRTTP
jgi:type VII secretion-associated serine protease mycosin